MVEFAGALTMPKMTPWSSVGASSFGRKHRQEEKHDCGDEGEPDPGRVNRRAHPQGRIELPAVPIAQAIEGHD